MVLITEIYFCRETKRTGIEKVNELTENQQTLKTIKARK